MSDAEDFVEEAEENEVKKLIFSTTGSFPFSGNCGIL